MAAELTGPRLAPRSRGPARQLVIFLHGYGADGNDLIELGRAWQNLLPDAAFVSPHAPEPCGQAPPGRHFIGEELKRNNLAGSALALVGFSQGSMMALHVGLRRAERPAAIVGYSGLFVLPDGSEPEAVAGEIKVRPPILLIHGDHDDLIPAQALFLSAQYLSALEIPTEWHMSAGLGHGIDQEGLRHGGEFLAKRFGAKRS